LIFCNAFGKKEIIMKIVKLSLENLDDVCNIENVCFAHPWNRESLLTQISLETSHFLVAEVDGKAVGYMGLQLFDWEGFVTNVAVLPEYRGQGIATALIKKQLKNPMDIMTLEVRESNTPAINLYTKCGFEIVGKRPKFYRTPEEDAIIMTKFTD
jgi:ribosomal-protein-alanine N-acetyltransferase